MIKSLLTLLCIALLALNASAQSQTFQIETISKPEKLLPTIPVSYCLYKKTVHGH
ncbi:hypothetical protein ACVWYN_003006 [Pedobacter sp. UYP24]